MRASLEHLAAVAVAGVPGITPVSVATSADDTTDFHSAVITDTTGKQWRVRSPLTDEASMRLAAEHSVLSSFTPQLRSTLPFVIPTVLGAVQDNDRRTFIYSHLQGHTVALENLDSIEHAQPTRPAPPSANPVPPIAEQIGTLLAAIHNLPRAMVMDADLPAYSSDQCRTRLLNELDQAATTGLIAPVLLQRWEEALEDRTLWRFSTHVVHGDLHEDNVIIDGNKIAAITGWSDVHVGDPAVDFAWLIGTGDPSFVEAVFATYSRCTLHEPDPHVLRRAHLEAEFTLARWLVRAVSRELPEMTAQAQHALAVLEQDCKALTDTH